MVREEVEAFSTPRLTRRVADTVYSTVSIVQNVQACVPARSDLVVPMLPCMSDNAICVVLLWLSPIWATDYCIDLLAGHPVLNILPGCWRC